jgi:hypothetical protein
MAIAPPGFMVAGPRIRSTGNNYGLFSVVIPTTLLEAHAWAGGVEWEFDLCTEVEAFTDQCPPDYT